MGKIKPDLAFAFTGKVGKNVYYESGNANCVRRLVENMKTSEDPACVAQRLKFRLVGKLGKALTKALRKGFANRPADQTPGNMFMNQNLQFVTVEMTTKEDENGNEVVDTIEGTLDFSKVLCAKGSLRGAQVSATYDEENHSLSLSATSNVSEFWGNEDDVLFVAVAMVDYELDIQQGILMKLGTRGEGGMKTVELPEEWAKEKIHAYAFAASAKGKDASLSTYLPLA